MIQGLAGSLHVSCCANLNKLDPYCSISVSHSPAKVLLAPLIQNLQLVSKTTLCCSSLAGLHSARLIMLATSFVYILPSFLVSLWTGSFQNIILFSAVLHRLWVSHLWFLSIIQNHLDPFHSAFIFFSCWLLGWNLGSITFFYGKNLIRWFIIVFLSYSLCLRHSSGQLCCLSI